MNTKNESRGNTYFIVGIICFLVSMIFIGPSAIVQLQNVATPSFAIFIFFFSFAALVFSVRTIAKLFSVSDSWAEAVMVVGGWFLLSVPLVLLGAHLGNGNFLTAVMTLVVGILTVVFHVKLASIIYTISNWNAFLLMLSGMAGSFLLELLLGSILGISAGIFH